MALGDAAIRMKRIAMATQGADSQVALAEGVTKGPQLPVAGQQLGRLAMRIARIRARADLNRLEPELDDGIEHLLERTIGQQNCEDAEFHVMDSHFRLFEARSMAVRIL